MTNDRTILVTGATGQQGGAAARELLSHGWSVRAMTRNPDGDAAGALKEGGAEVVRGDYAEPDSVREALDGVWGAFSLQNTWEAGVEKEEEQGKHFARLAREAGVEHLVYASVGSADRDTGIPHFDNKWRIEETIRDLDFPSYTIVRPVFFMENLASPWFKPSIDEGKLVMGVEPDTSLQMIAVEDIGKHHFRAFERHEELNGKAVDVAGDELTLPEAARIISEVAGREVEFVQQPIEEVRAWSEDFALMLEWFDEVGYDVDIEALEEETGAEHVRFASWARQVDWS